MRRAPTLEQLVAFRQRRAYFSITRAAKQRAARIASKLRTTANTDEEVRQAWIDATIEPPNLANPIERSLPAAEEDPEL